MNRLKWQWEENPMLPPMVFMAAGIWAGSTLNSASLLYGLVLLMLLLVAALLLRNHFDRGQAAFRSLLAWGLCLSSGAGLPVFRLESTILSHHEACQGIFTDVGESGENGSRRCLARILRIRSLQGGWQDGKGSAVLWLKAAPAPESRPGQADGTGFRSGQSFTGLFTLRGIPAPELPGQFDAQKWYQSQGICWQQFCTANQILITEENNSCSLSEIAQNCRRKLEKIFLRHLPENDAAMLSALLLGIRRKMDPQLKTAYSEAGLTHILAVSGMHVALIFGFLSFLLQRIKKFRYGNILFFALITSLLWFYALITGLSPSVLRAVTLFTVLQAGELLQKPSLPLNNLCFASILLMLADEQILFDLGYQLSFSAVYGIISFQPVFQQFFRAKNLILRFISENLSVTLAASLSTLPLIIYHFHRFPVYFLISNLFALPFSNLLIYAGIALLVFSPIPLLAGWIALVLHYGFSILNGFVQLVNSLPHSSIGNFYPSPVQACCLFITAAILRIFPGNSLIKILPKVLPFVFLLSLTLFAEKFLINEEVDFNAGIRYRKNWFFLRKTISTGSLLSLNPAADHPEFLQKGLKLQSLQKETCTQISLIPEKKSVVGIFQGKSFLLLNHYIKGKAPGRAMPIDLLLLGDAGEKSLLQALHFFRPKEIWTDWPLKRQQKFQQKHGLPVISFREQKLRKIEP